MSQRRRFSRVMFNAPARLSVGGAEQPVAVLDMSLHGALLEYAGTDLAPGAACRLEMALDATMSICMDARVSHIEPGKLGIRCVAIDLDSVSHLRRLVELNLGDEQILHRDLAALIAPA